MDFSKALFWVQVHDMPLICMNRDIGYRIGESLGTVEEVDVTGDGMGWGRCLRIRVYLDLTRPLDKGRALHINGKSVWVSFKYEKLPQFCYTCGRIVHGPNSCKGGASFRLNGGAPVKQWGAWLRADDLRYRSNSSLMGVKDLVKPGRETLGQTAAEPYGEGEGMSFPENQVVFPKPSSTEKTVRPQDDNAGMENGVKGIEVESKEGEVRKARKGSFNAEDSGSEVLGDTLECPNRMNLCQVAKDETNISSMQGLLGENFSPIHESTLNVNPGPLGSVSVGLSSAHSNYNNEAEEPLMIGVETDLVIQETQEPSSSLM
jgi:hypothetical protein